MPALWLRRSPPPRQTSSSTAPRSTMWMAPRTGPVEALAINALAVRSLARAAEAAGAMLVHYSSDFVLNSESTEPHDEDVRPSPLRCVRLVQAAGRMVRARGPAGVRAPRREPVRIAGRLDRPPRHPRSHRRRHPAGAGREGVHRPDRLAELLEGCRRGDQASRGERGAGWPVSLRQRRTRELVRGGRARRRRFSASSRVWSRSPWTRCR